MTKPADISQQAWDEAEKVALQYVEWLVPKPTDYSDAEYVLATIVARAIMAATAAERERCALIADESVFDKHELAQATEYGRGMDAASRAIATAIRQGSQPPKPFPHMGAMEI